LGEIYHVFGVSAICWTIWKARNIAGFDKVVIKSLLDIFCHICALMNYWAGLYAEPDKEQIIEGINTMLKVMKGILKRQKEEAEATKQLQDGGTDLDNAGV